jgi:GAF domain-containing protein
MRNDPNRLAELRQRLILDSSAERAYDDIVQMLAKGLQVPMTMVNLLDEQRDWYKAGVGLPFNQSPAATSFCEAFFRTEDDLIVVQDTFADPRFAHHPFVAGPPFIRFYAAARLRVNEQTLGTLCAYDFRPRQLVADQLRQVQELAAAAATLLRKRDSSSR